MYFINDIIAARFWFGTILWVSIRRLGTFTLYNVACNGAAHTVLVGAPQRCSCRYKMSDIETSTHKTLLALTATEGCPISRNRHPPACLVDRGHPYSVDTIQTSTHTCGLGLRRPRSSNQSGVWMGSVPWSVPMSATPWGEVCPRTPLPNQGINQPWGSCG